MQANRSSEPQTRDCRTRPMRTGPVGRTVRVLLAAGLATMTYGLWRTGMSNFSDPEILRQSGFWLITAVVVKAIYDAAAQQFGRSWAWRVLTALVVLVGVLAAIATLNAGTAWASPLTWLVFLAELVIPAVVAVVFVLSAMLGTPGCEYGAVRELIARVRGVYQPGLNQPVPCSVGLHLLDAWEARQKWRQRGHTTAERE